MWIVITLYCLGKKDKKKSLFSTDTTIVGLTNSACQHQCNFSLSFIYLFFLDIVHLSFVESTHAEPTYKYMKGQL